MNNDINEYFCGLGTGADINTDQMVWAERAEASIYYMTSKQYWARDEAPDLGKLQNTNI